jgi:HamA
VARLEPSPFLRYDVELAWRCNRLSTFTVKESLDALLEALRVDYEAHFCHVEHSIVCDGPPQASIRLHYVRPDASGEPRFRELAKVLAKYITLYCFKAERRKDLSELQRNEMFMRARDLFRLAANSGQVGELLIYFLLETVLRAPQALKKMPLTTNPKEERKGSDGVHVRWDESDRVLELIFAESKIWKSFSAALADAFRSMETFHDARTRQHEINILTSGFSNLHPELQREVASYIEGENVSRCRLVHACLIGFNWAEYECLTDDRRADFIKEFEGRYREWLAGIRDSLNDKLKAFKHKHLRLEFFMLPFSDVEAFRAWFDQELTGTQ